MRRIAAVALACALALSACSSAGPGASASPTVAGVDDIVIGTAEGSLAPTLTFPEGAEFTRPDGEVIWRGEGAPLVDDQPLLLDVYAVSVVDGTEVANTFDGLPRPYVLAPEVVGDDLYSLLIRVNVGARVLVLAPPNDEETSTPAVAMVVDVLSERAVGEELPQPEGMPIVTRSATGEPSITIPDDVEEPTELQVATLIQGAGAQVRQGSFVTVNYEAVYWEDGTEFDSSWPTEKAPYETQIGVGQVIPAWDIGLLDQTVGSQVLLVAPPTYAYADKGTLVFVVDILDVWNPEG